MNHKSQTSQPTYLLESLPYPLLPPQRTKSKGAPSDFFGYFRREPSLKDARYRQLHSQDRNTQASLDCWEELVNLKSVGTNLAEQNFFARENSLRQVFGDFYCSDSLSQTPLLRATALYESLALHYTERGRISRMTAAWVWGYLDAPDPSVHIDFDRALRLNVTRARAANIMTHQVRVIPYDYIELGKLRVTTPLRTALDLLFHEQTAAADEVLIRILRDPESGCSQMKLLDAMDRISYLRFKDRTMERLERLARLARGKISSQPPKA
ncbi:type IV toxin-antitoxin system AbiEi family antitoxin [Rothia aerolata]|uniref:Uncharacterized protein n=1 Tax=Rothia aerolata TaxID=1812262 RepID=A0A917MQE2_9MICC|nr:type IV toxin-antitoxin system AbiEi family antitoxin [Rothia aerolata]GGH57853.1 hypothetical protein GCM10007359_03430 [Rothia aerolata]